jgi:predicted transglutaminase-like cysteine proteinase
MGRQMRFLHFARALRAAILACGMIWFGSAENALAGPAGISYGMTLSFESAEPFGLTTSPVDRGSLRVKWLGVERKLEDERVQLALCDGDREHCASDAALKFLAIVDSGRQHEGRARLGEINRAVNLAIHPMDDIAQWGEVDVWSSPLVTFYHGAGDCEDYAIAKYVALRMAGVAAEDLRILVLVDFHGEGHAVAAARLDGHWLLLDNRRMAMVEDVNARIYRPLFVIDDSGLMRYSDVPQMASLPEHATPAIATDPQPGLVATSN